MSEHQSAVVLYTCGLVLMAAGIAALTMATLLATNLNAAGIPANVRACLVDASNEQMVEFYASVAASREGGTPKLGAPPFPTTRSCG